MADDRSLETLTAEDFRDIAGTRFQLKIDHPEMEGRVAFQLCFPLKQQVDALVLDLAEP